MPKSMTVDPADLRKSGVLKIPSIPMNQYKRNFSTEIATYGKDGLVAMLHDMIAIREFESMLNSIKTTGAWNGVEYNHKGPAHLSLGQEAASVGQAAALDPDDFIFGSHPQPWRNPRQMLFGGTQTRSQIPRIHHEGIPGRRDSPIRGTHFL